MKLALFLAFAILIGDYFEASATYAAEKIWGAVAANWWTPRIVWPLFLLFVSSLTYLMGKHEGEHKP